MTALARDRRSPWMRGVLLLALTALVLLHPMPGSAASLQFSESFGTEDHRASDATTAVWDSARGEVRLPESAPVWSAMSTLAGQRITAIAFAPASPDTIFVGISDGILRSTDGGTVWTRVGTANQSVEAIALSPSFASDGMGFAMSNGDGIWRTTDGGTTWTRANATSGLAVVTSPAFATDQTVFAAGFDGVRRSTDAGATWAPLRTGMEHEVIANGDIRGVAVSSLYATDRTVYATTFSFGVYRSTDAGVTWVLDNPSGLTVPSAGAVAADSGGTIAVAFLDGVYLRDGGSAQWVFADANDATDLAFSPTFASDATVFFATVVGPLRWVSGAGAAALEGWTDGRASAIAVTPTYAATGRVLAATADAVFARERRYARTAVAESLAVDATAATVTRATVTADAVLPSGTTITYEASASTVGGTPQWEGPLTPGVPWTFAHTGSDLRWRATLATSDGSATPLLRAITIAYDTARGAPVPDRGTPTATTIRWSFTDAETDATAYEVRVGDPGSADDRVVATAEGTARAATETGRSPNTEYCTRRVVARIGSASSPSSPAFPCVVTLAARPDAPVAREVTSTSARLEIAASGNPADTEFALQETTSGAFIGSDGTLGTTAVWRTRAAWDGIDARGLIPERDYAFCVRARSRTLVETECSASTDVRTTAAPLLRGSMDLVAAITGGADGPLTRGRDITVVVTARNASAGDAYDAVVTVPMPDGVASIPASLHLNNQPVSDASDGDRGERTGSDAVFRIGTIAAGTSVPVQFTARVREDAGAAITVLASGTYRPLPSLEPTTALAAPLRRDVEPEGGVLEATPPSDGAVIGGGPASATIVLATPREGEETNAIAIIARGSAPPGSSIEVRLDTEVVGRTVSDALGDFAVVLPSTMPEGAHAVAAVTSVAGSELRATAAFTVDRTPPDAPTITELAIPERNISSVVPGAFDVTMELRGAFTADAFPTIAAVLVTVESDPVTIAFTPSGMVWSHRFTVPLEPGSHTVRVAARDRAGNVSFAPSTVTFAVAPAACGDGADNDGDGATDYPADSDCANALDATEEPEGVLERVRDAARAVAGTTAAAVAETTATAARATARVAERVSETTRERVLDNPAVETATERVIAPVVAVAVVANTATAVQGFQLFAYLQHLVGIFLQPGRLLARRKRKAWGTVFSTATKRPVDLATVRLVVAGTGSTVQTAVTDALGRYAFIAKRPGQYRMLVTHPEYTFPSAAPGNPRVDGEFVDCYYGEPIPVTDAGALVTVNVPVDLAARAAAPVETIVRRRRLSVLSNGVANGGLVLSIVSFGISPRPLIGTFLAVNLVVYFLFRRLAAGAGKRPKSWGTITDAVTAMPIAFAVVRIFDTQFNKLLETAVTDRYGRYSFLVGKNTYYVTAEKAGYAPVRTATLDLSKREGIVGVDLRLPPKAVHRPANASTPVRASRSDGRRRAV